MVKEVRVLAVRADGLDRQQMRTLADSLRTRIKLYQAGSPYHETPDHRQK